MTTQMDLKCLKKQGSSPKLYTLYLGVTLYTQDLPIKYIVESGVLSV